MRTRLWAGFVLCLLSAAVLAWQRPAVSADAQEATIHLFNGKDLTNFYTYLGAPEEGREPYGKNHDPLKVFTVRDEHIRISGQVFGGLVTEKPYENYRLVTEWSWGKETWPPRKHKARDSGIFLHCTGKEGVGGRPWPEAIECNIMEGATGDLVLVPGRKRPTFTSPSAEKPVGRGKAMHKERYYERGGPPVAVATGQVHWYGRDPFWQDVKGFRGKKDVERPAGEWNRLECICEADKITVMLNGKVVNACTQASIHKGRILFQSEGAEIFFRKIDLTPLEQK